MLCACLAGIGVPLAEYRITTFHDVRFDIMADNGTFRTVIVGGLLSGSGCSTKTFRLITGIVTDSTVLISVILTYRH